MTESQGLLDIFEPPACPNCLKPIGRHDERLHEPSPWRGLRACRAQQASGEVALLWVYWAAMPYRCRDGELIRDGRPSHLATVEHFIAKARDQWRANLAAFDALLTAYARYTGALDLLTGDAYLTGATIARPSKRGWRLEPWGGLS